MSLKDKHIHPAQLQIIERRGTGNTTPPAETRSGGMTLLEHFAGLALQGELAGQDQEGHWPMTEKHAAICARKSVLFAKALIAELEKEQQS